MKVLRVDRGERKIGLSRKKAHWSKADEDDDSETHAAPSQTARPESKESKEPKELKELKELKGGLSGGGPLFGVGTASTEDGESNG